VMVHSMFSGPTLGVSVFSGGYETNIGTRSAVCGPGDRLYSCVSGSSFGFWVNSTCVGSLTNALFASGMTGVWVSGDATRSDDFEGGNF
jgi:hypothetical protein